MACFVVYSGLTVLCSRVCLRVHPQSFLRWLWCLRTGVAIHGTFDFVLFMAPMVATPESDSK